jgi:alpha-galactosidase
MIDYQESASLFHLRSRDFSYIIEILETGHLVHRYFGKKVKSFSSDNKITYLDRAFSPNPTSKDRTFSLDTLQLEYSSNVLKSPKPLLEYSNCKVSKEMIREQP